MGCVAEGLEQTAEYMDRCAAESGHLVIFDRRADRRWDDKVFQGRRGSSSGVAIEAWGCEKTLAASGRDLESLKRRKL